MEKTGTNDSGYGWIIIVFGSLINIALSLAYMCMPVLFNEISKDLGLSLSQLGVVWGMIGLGSMVMSLFGGLLGDKYGTKRIIFISLFVVGATGLLRAYSPDFFWLAFTTFLFGLGHTTVSLNIHKATGVWFTGKNIVISNGVLCTTMGIGMMMAAGISDTIVSPLVGGWKNVFLLYGAICIALALLWVMITKSDIKHRPGSRPGESPAFFESFSNIIRIKELWAKSLLNMCFYGSFTGVVGYLPLYLRKIGWLPAEADSALTVLYGTSLLAVMPLTVLAGKVRSKKTLLFYLLLLDMTCVALLPFATGPAIWVLCAFFGMVMDAYVAILLTIIIETKGIGARYSGTAIGLVFSFGNLGAFLISSTGNALANINLRYGFVLWAVLFGVAAIILGLILINEKKIPVSKNNGVKKQQGLHSSLNKSNGVK